jgi:hypothetical protein
MSSPLPAGTKVKIMKSGSEYNGMRGVTIGGLSDDGKYSVEVLDTRVRPNPIVDFEQSEIGRDAELQEKFTEVQKRATGKTGGRKSRKSRGKKRVTRKKRSTRRR